MVRALHAAGIEVILDVVYNHTAEGGEGGPTLSLRGIDNAGYYRLQPHNRRAYADYTGCGNTLDSNQPQVLRLIADSLRYKLPVGVDGPVSTWQQPLARSPRPPPTRCRWRRSSPPMSQDPVLSTVKLIADPWDVRHGQLPGRRVPATVDGVERQVPRHRPRLLARSRDRTWRNWAPRLAGSVDLYQQGRTQALRLDQLHHRARRLHHA